MVKRLSEPRSDPPAGIGDGSSQNAVTATDLDHMENGRVSEQVPHLPQLPRDQGAENRMTRGRGAEVGADPAAPGRTKTPTGRVKAGLHEPSECDSPILLNEAPDLLVNW